jgi:hypothetical protein
MKNSTPTPLRLDGNLTVLELVCLGLALDTTIERGTSKCKECFPAAEDLEILRSLSARCWSLVQRPDNAPFNVLAHESAERSDLIRDGALHA